MSFRIKLLSNAHVSSSPSSLFNSSLHSSLSLYLFFSFFHSPFRLSHVAFSSSSSSSTDSVPPTSRALVLHSTANIPPPLQICRKFSGNPSLIHHCRVPKRDMSPLHQLYFDVVHKILVPRQERRVEANYLDMTLMELLDSEIPINLPSIMIKHMQRVLIQDGNGHALPYGFWLALIFEDYKIPVQVWDLQTTKDVIGRVNHARLPASMRKADTPINRLQLELDAQVAELLEARTAFDQDKAILSARIADLEATLAKERAEHLTVVHKLTLMIPSASPPA